MRVLDTTTLEFKEFPDLPDEPYAILSHRWGIEEVSFKEYRKSRDAVQHCSGYKKIVDFCRITRQRGFRYAWVDTCCIDKRSSAELSEAINSMYRWYKRSAQCYVYLDDYDPDDSDSLRACKWFTRGWTLQELIAPMYCVFFTSTWDAIGHKHHWTAENCSCCKIPAFQPELDPTWGRDILDTLVAVTGINDQILSGVREPSEASVAQRMSWASERTTTREEDRAYSLLGIFDINMPLLYGEGPRAFRRLQEEIIRTTHDTSIFCFGVHHLSRSETASYQTRARIPLRPRPLLAQSPAQFSYCGDICKGIITADEPYSITNRGLRIVTPAYSQKFLKRGNNRQVLYAIPLACHHESRQALDRQPFYLVISQDPVGGDARVGLRVGPPQSEGSYNERWTLTENRIFHIRL